METTFSFVFRGFLIYSSGNTDTINVVVDDAHNICFHADGYFDLVVNHSAWLSVFCDISGSEQLKRA
jgi:hypothetical protein